MHTCFELYEMNAYFVKIQMACVSADLLGSMPPKESKIKHEHVFHFHNVNGFYET
jgi:hypothetical protein